MRVGIDGFSFRDSHRRVSPSGSTLVVMSVTIDLPDGALAKLQAEAARRGVTIDEVIANFAATLVAERDEKREGYHRPAFVAVGSSKAGISHQVGELLAEGFGRD